MEGGRIDYIKKSTWKTISFDPSHKRQNLMKNIKNLSSLMKSRINTEISPKAFIKQFKLIFLYMIVMLIIIIIFMKFYLALGIINLFLASLGTIFLYHGIFKKFLATYRTGSAFWILELLATANEIVTYIFNTFGKIFSGETSFFIGLLKFIRITVGLAAFLLACFFFTYHIMDFQINFQNNNNGTNNGNLMFSREEKMTKLKELKNMDIY